MYFMFFYINFAFDCMWLLIVWSSDVYKNKNKYLAHNDLGYFVTHNTTSYFYEYNNHIFKKNCDD